MCTVLTSLDLSAAFDTIDHAIFLRRLNVLYGVDAVPLTQGDNMWCSTGLSLRNKTLHNVHRSIHSNNSASRHSVPHIYAADIQLYVKCHNDDNSLNQAIIQLQNSTRHH